MVVSSFEPIRDTVHNCPAQRARDLTLNLCGFC